jgi:uncharacterized membrane protein YccF (DUF307 family)
MHNLCINVHTCCTAVLESCIYADCTIHTQCSTVQRACIVSACSYTLIWMCIAGVYLCICHVALWTEVAYLVLIVRKLNVQRIYPMYIHHNGAKH